MLNSSSIFIVINDDLVSVKIMCIFLSLMAGLVIQSGRIEPCGFGLICITDVKKKHQNNIGMKTDCSCSFMSALKKSMVIRYQNKQRIAVSAHSCICAIIRHVKSGIFFGFVSLSCRPLNCENSNTGPMEKKSRSVWNCQMLISSDSRGHRTLWMHFIIFCFIWIPYQTTNSVCWS